MMMLLFKMTLQIPPGLERTYIKTRSSSRFYKPQVIETEINTVCEGTNVLAAEAGLAGMKTEPWDW